MATFFDLIARPNESIKSKTTGKFIKLSNPPDDLKVSNDWDVKPGDVLSWSDYRTTETYFVTPERTLLKNPDTSGAGYLTIPISITSLFPDAINHFSSILNAIGRNYVTSIELSPTDSFFISHFSKEPLPITIANRNDISYSYDPNEENLNVIIASNPDQSQYFSLATTKMNDIIEWISVANEPKAKFTVKFNFEGKEICSKAPRGIINGLPIGWQCEQKGVLMFGDDKIRGEWKYFIYVINGIGKDYVSTIEMHPNDIFIQKKIGVQVPTELHSRRVEFIYDSLKEFLYVNIPYTLKSKEFKLGSTTMKDIETWFNSVLEDQSSFRIKYDFSGAQFQKYRDEWIFHGDRKHLNDAKKKCSRLL